MIDFEHVSLSYQTGPVVLADVNLSIAEGDLVVVCGPTGAGKSTLLGAINGHVPHFTGGTLRGRVRVNGRDTADQPPRDLADLIGVVPQDPLAGFVTDTVEEELAYGMEQLGVDPQVMRLRVEETMDILGLAGLRDRALSTLSGGQQQRVAIGAVLATGVRVLVLDEPTSALDPVSAEEVLASLVRLVHDIGLTVVVAEHRLERVLGYADQVLVLDGRGGAQLGDPAAMMGLAPIVPPVVELGRVAGWSPLPLTVRDARRQAGDLRSQLSGLDPAQFSRGPTVQARPTAAAGLVVRDLTVTYGSTVAVNRCSADFPTGQVTALMGRNGSGKSSLLWALAGLQPATGRFWVGGDELTKATPANIRARLRLVPQTATDLLYLPSVGAELAAADRESGRAAGVCQTILDRLAPGIDPAANPRDLSEGQKLALVLAIQLSAEPDVLLLDEPTRGLDYPAKANLAQLLSDQAGSGRAVVVVTHDVEFAAQVGDRAVVMATGEVIQTGAIGQVLASSALFASQVAKVLYPSGWLTPYQVGQALRPGTPT